MAILTEALPPHRIRLGLRATDQAEAIQRTVEVLRDAPGTRDFAKLAQAIQCCPATKLGSPGREILIAHARTESVERLLLAASRLDLSAAQEIPKLIFVAVIPAAFNTEYLRAVGAIARACSTPKGYDALNSARTAAEFSSLLEAAELALSK